MRSIRRAAAFAALSSLPMLAAAAAQCPHGTTAVAVSGRATTVNLSQTKQVGQICLTLTAADGRELFDDCGAMIGKVVGTEADSGTPVVADTAVFDLLDSFQSTPHAAQVTAVLQTDADGNPCSLTTSEHTTALQYGTGIFAGATVDVFANGSVNFCPGHNLDTYQLTGQACVRTRRH